MASPVDVIAPATEYVWPELSPTDKYIIWAINIGALLFSWVLLRLIWAPPSPEEVKVQKEVELKIQDIQRQYSTFGRASRSRDDAKECLEGDSAGDYSAPWTETFDVWFVAIMAGFLVVLIVWTQLTHPELFTNYAYWGEQLPKVLLMIAVSLVGGLLCRYFCEVDEKGYIITNKNSVFKVNYTRKLQHFAAYLVPLLLHTRAAESIRGPLTLSWGSWFTLLGFLILIKPLREHSKFIMLQFNALDRPEDRPNTLSWIVGGNIIPGAILIIFFRWVYSYTGQQDMSYIFLFITGIGDGFAEPIGIYLGRHKYWTTSCFGDRKYQRSWEGSYCVFYSGILFVSILWYTFKSPFQFWTSLIVVPPLMAYAEATSPHTIDTPFLMGLGGLALFIVSHLEVMWI